jgi:hypothetical protein
MGQFLAQSARDGKPLWRTFWVGDTTEGGAADQRTPRYGTPAAGMVAPAVWGVTAPWTLVLSAGLGIWLMFAPAALGSEPPSAHSDRLVGALVVTVAVTVTAEVVRVGRFVNVLFGAWIVVAPWLLSGASSTARWNAAIVGVALIALSIPRGRIAERYGSWDRYVVWPHAAPAAVAPVRSTRVSGKPR